MHDPSRTSTPSATGRRILLRAVVALALLLVVTAPASAPAATTDPVITTYAGGPGDGPATSVAQMPFAVAVHDGPSGRLVYVADLEGDVVRVLDMATGFESVVAGTGVAGFSGDGGPATSAQLHDPQGVAVDASGNLFIGDTQNQRVRRVDAATKVITTVAGSGPTTSSGFSGDGGPATSARLALPGNLAVDGSGNLFIADAYNYRVRRVDAASQVITTVAGRDYRGSNDTNIGDGGPATNALISPIGIHLDSAGDLFIADTLNNANRIRRVDAATQVITTVAGNGTVGSSGDGGPATSAQLSFPTGVTFDSAGNMLISEFTGYRVRRVDAATQVITTVAGTGTPGFSGDGGPATAAQLNGPYALALDSAGNMFIADYVANRIRRVDAATQVMTTVAGNGSVGSGGDGGPAASAQLSANDVAADAAGNLFVADSTRVRRVAATTKVITTVAGNGTAGFSGDGGPATSAQLSAAGVAVDAAGNLFIADRVNDRVRRVDAATQIITTVAGGGPKDPLNVANGDGGPATLAVLFRPQGVAVDPAGNLFVTDTDYGRIRRVDAANQIITTVAGTLPGFAGDGGPAVAAQLRSPRSVDVDAAGNLFIADTANNRVRRVDAATLNITTVVGTGTAGFGGDGGPAAAAALNVPGGVDIDPSGVLLVADTGNHRVRRADPAGQKITTVAGTGAAGSAGDGGPATSGQLNSPGNVDVDATGAVFIADGANKRVRRVAAAATAAVRHVAADFDGDADSDVAVFRPNGVAAGGCCDGAWHVQGGLSTGWGVDGDVPVPADYNGDGKTDVAVYRPADQSWHVQGGVSTQWGQDGDVPVPADYDGNGNADIAVFRPSDQTWYVQGGLATQWGANGDVPVPGDYDGNGTTDVAVFRPGDQTWYVQGGLSTQWGVNGDVPVAADYNGDGKTDVAVYRPADQTWFSQTGMAAQWGTTGDIAVPADYTGDGKADVAVFRKSDRTWYVQGGLTTQFGAPGDVPVVVPAHLRSLYGL